MKTLDLPGIRKVNRGKVREIFEVGPDRLLIVATDRISAFDVVLPNVIPNKGKVLNQISAFWFKQLAHVVPGHVIADRVEDFPPQLRPFDESLRGRSMLVRKCRPLP